MAGGPQGYYQSNSNTNSGGIFLHPGAIVVKGSGYSLSNARGGEPLCDRPTIQPACRDCIVSFHCLYSNVGRHDFLPSDLARSLIERCPLLAQSGLRRRGQFVPEWRKTQDSSPRTVL